MEDVAEVAAAIRALDLDSPAVTVRDVRYRSRDLLVEGGPAAARVELRVGGVQRRVALPAEIGALDVEVVVFAGERKLGAFVEDDPRLFRIKFVHVNLI